MSLPLKDYRTAVPEAVDLWLEIEAAATGKDKATVGREVLNAWAKEKIHAHKKVKRPQRSARGGRLQSEGGRR